MIVVMKRESKYVHARTYNTSKNTHTHTTHTGIYCQTDRHTDRQTDGQIDKQTDRHTYIQTDKQTDRHTEKQTDK